MRVCSSDRLSLSASRKAARRVFMGPQRVTLMTEWLSVSSRSRIGEVALGWNLRETAKGDATRRYRGYGSVNTNEALLALRAETPAARCHGDLRRRSLGLSVTARSLVLVSPDEPVVERTGTAAPGARRGERRTIGCRLEAVPSLRPTHGLRGASGLWVAVRCHATRHADSEVDL
jgi:hypothetical protein